MTTSANIPALPIQKTSRGAVVDSIAVVVLMVCEDVQDVQRQLFGRLWIK